MNDPTPAADTGRFLARLRSGERTVAVELRPPRSGLTRGGAMDTWIDLSHAIRGLVSRDAFLMLTDSAIGQEEEENLQHLTANLAGEVDAWRVIPFLTCKHPLDYCLRYGDRARAHGVESLTVVGGDAEAGAERCVPHAYLLRDRLRSRIPSLTLGGWVNLHRPTAEQLAFAMDEAYEADFYLTQVVSHHDLPKIDRWLSAAAEAGFDLPGAFGVFYYRNGRREVLERLSRFFPVPVDSVAEAFESGVSAERHCAETIRALRALGVTNLYLCNLGARHAAAHYDRIMDEVAALESP